MRTQVLAALVAGGALLAGCYQMAVPEERNLELTRATRQEWLDSLDTHGWPTHMISTIAGVGHRVVAVIGGPHRENAPDECTCRCQQGRHCGGCGHEGCGYTA